MCKTCTNATLIDLDGSMTRTTILHRGRLLEIWIGVCDSLLGNLKQYRCTRDVATGYPLYSFPGVGLDATPSFAKSPQNTALSPYTQSGPFKVVVFQRGETLFCSLGRRLPQSVPNPVLMHDVLPNIHLRGDFRITRFRMLTGSLTKELFA